MTQFHNGLTMPYERDKLLLETIEELCSIIETNDCCLSDSIVFEDVNLGKRRLCGACGWTSNPYGWQRHAECCRYGSIHTVIMKAKLLLELDN